MKTKYLTIKDYLSGLIKKGRDGDPLPSESELCSLMSASRITVRRAIDELDKGGMIYRHKGKGFFIRETEKIKVPLQIAIGAASKIPFSEKIISGCMKFANENCLGVHFFSTRWTPREIEKVLSQYDFNGIIGIAPYLKDYITLENLRQRGVPVLIINRIEKNTHYSYVSSDHENTAFRITEYLLKKGHRNIAFFGHSCMVPLSKNFLAGYLKAFQLSGLKPPPSSITDIPETAEEDFFRQAGKYFSRIMKKNKYDSLVISSQRFFTESALPFLNEKGIRIPQDVEIALCDELPAGSIYENCIHEASQPFERLGFLGMEKMVNIIRGTEGKVNTLVPVEIKFKDVNKDCGK